jgi:hypothetical protein
MTNNEKASDDRVGCLAFVIIVVVVHLLFHMPSCSRTEPPVATEKAPAASKAADAGALDFTGLRGVLPGKWKKTSGDSSDIIDITEKTIEENHFHYVGKWEKKGDSLYITDDHGQQSIYVLEFVSDAEIALSRESEHNWLGFGYLAGRWKRISLPPSDIASSDPAPVADAKRQVKRIEEKVAKLESLLKATQADRDDLVAKLRAVGVNTPADLKDNIRGQRLAENLAKIATEIDGMERQLGLLDSETLKAKSIVRRMEMERAGISENEMQQLAQQLREVQERTDGVASTPTTPLDVQAALEKALKAVPKGTTSKTTE